MDPIDLIERALVLMEWRPEGGPYIDHLLLVQAWKEDAKGFLRGGEGGGGGAGVPAPVEPVQPVAPELSAVA